MNSEYKIFMHTKIVRVEGNLSKISEEFINGPVAFPTETVYGLGASVWREDLIKKVFEIKNRPQDNPLIVHVSSLDMLRKCIVGDIPEVYNELINEFWPGPLTLLFKKATNLPYSVTAGSEYVAVRMPDHKDILRVIDYLGEPIVGPSANKSGRPSPTTAQHVFDDLNGDVSLIIDGGMCEKGIESTIVNGILDTPLLLRAGAISYEEVKEYIPKLEIHGGSGTVDGTIAPGTRYKHYSPTATVIMITGTKEAIRQKLFTVASLSKALDKDIVCAESKIAFGFLLPDEYQNIIQSPDMVYLLGNNTKEAAHRIFDGLRYLDRHVSVIYTVEIEKTKEGRGVMDRLTKATTHFI
ncbi:L-threonylcarbamoyladenylate synthase [Nematocida parisii]|nr:L-threonylcarbamoyladenylate synthase [Nematocida parisii]KAI5126213.1 L-threonylcarbamoyladenylate synthase [Nematocida parisii]